MSNSKYGIVIIIALSSLFSYAYSCRENRLSAEAAQYATLDTPLFKASGEAAIHLAAAEEEYAQTERILETKNAFVDTLFMAAASTLLLQHTHSPVGAAGGVAALSIPAFLREGMVMIAKSSARCGRTCSPLLGTGVGTVAREADEGDSNVQHFESESDERSGGRKKKHINDDKDKSTAKNSYDHALTTRFSQAPSLFFALPDDVSASLASPPPHRQRQALALLPANILDRLDWLDWLNWMLDQTLHCA